MYIICQLLWCVTDCTVITTVTTIAVAADLCFTGIDTIEYTITTRNATIEGVDSSFYSLTMGSYLAIMVR
jgi:hypothetical protein